MHISGVAVWGLGRHARNRILPALALIKELPLVGVCSRNRNKVEDCAEQNMCYSFMFYGCYPYQFGLELMLS